MSKSKLLHFLLPLGLLCGGFALRAQTVTILDESFPNATANPIVNVNAGLTNDVNSFSTPTATQAAYASFGTANLNYVQATSITIAAGNRGLIAYFTSSVPSSFVSLAVGDSITGTVTFSYAGGTGAAINGDFRLGLFNSGGGATNLASAASRYPAGISNSLTALSNARGYGGYIVSSTASNTASNNTQSFWLRSPSVAGSQQIIGPTGTDMSAVVGTFDPIGALGGGAAAAIKNDGTVYVATFTATHVSATEMDLSYTVKDGATTVMSYAQNQTSGTLVTSFDSLMILSLYNAALTVRDIVITKTTPVPAPAAPTAAAASGPTATGFSTNWAASTGATGYRLDVATDNAFGTFVPGYQDKDVGNVLTSAVNGLTANTAYYYRVRAYNGAGSSASSNIISQTTLVAAPAAPTATAASGATASGFSVNWAASTNATGYRLDVSTDNAFGTFVTGYQDKDVGNVLTSAVAGLTASTAYSYRVRAYNGSGTSASSNIISVTTSSGSQTTTIVHDSFTATAANAGLATDANSLLVPTSTQAVWATFGTANPSYVQNASIGVSAGATRGLIAYFQPSTSLTNLAVGETLSASITFKFTGGTLSETAGNFRLGLFNSGGNGTATNIGGAARFASGVSNSLTGTPTGNTARGYSGYIVDTKAASTASTDTQSFWFRVPSATSGGGSTQIAGPTATDLQASATFLQLGVAGGGAAGALLNDGSTLYTATFTVKYVSATQVDLAYVVKTGSTTVMSYAYSQTSGTLATSFDSLMIFSTYAAAPTITDLNIVKIAPGGAPVPPTITTQPSPASQTVAAGSNVTYSVVAAGTSPFTYQWKNGTTALADSTGHITGATTATLTLTSTQVSDTGSYTVVVTNAGGNITSNAAALTVTASGPVITVQPQPQSALIGTRATFSVLATGVGPFSYQWNKGGNPISGATGQSLVLTNLQASDAGNYSVTVTNTGGPATSFAATLTVLAPATTLPTQPTIPAGVFRVTDYGAVGDGVTDNTAFIQAAITAAQTAGGGTIELPPAANPYLTGPITLRSSMNLQIDGGATLRALPRTSYPNFATAPADLITVASSATNVAITGTGTIEGDGTAWWTAYNANNNLDRPRLIQFTKATNVLISGITLQNSPQFHIAMSGSGGTGNSNVTIFGLTISAPTTSPNTDGIDPTGSNILIQKCTIGVGDDNIAIKAQNGVCANITVDNCTFGTGHGLSIGGQTNYGLDTLTVTNCTFTGTTSGLRLKADPTQGGLVQNLTYSNITMTGVQYPIVFYSYYNQVGNPGAISGSNQITVAKVLSTNATPPNALTTSTLPVWKNITISNLTATGATGYSTIWGLPLASGLIANVTLNNVSITGGPGLEIYNATNVQLTGTSTTSTVGPFTTANSLMIASQPLTQTVNTGDPVSLSVATVGTSGVNGTLPTYQWSRNGTALTNGTLSNGTVVAGATTAALALTNTHPGDTGSYTCTVSNTLDGYNAGASSLAADSLAVSATSAAATVTVTGSGTVPTITSQPVSVSVRVGDPASFTVAATTDSPLTYQWKLGSTALEDSEFVTGTHSATLLLSRPQPTDAGSYTVVLTNSSGNVTSSAATLKVNVLPVITQQPLAQSVYVGDKITLTVSATGTTPFAYVWSKDGVALANSTRISGATSATLTITGAQLTDAGVYAVVVSNDAGLTNSTTATLKVSPVPTPPLAPVANAATGIDSASFVASWNSTLDTVGYYLDVSTSSSFGTFVSGYQALDVGTSLSRAVVGLKPLTNYYFRVRAYNAVGSSPNSATISLTTLDTSFAPKFTSASGTTFTVGIASNFTVTTAGKPTPTVTATGLPSWVTFNATTGVLSGTAPAGTASGQFVINFAATNAVAPDAALVFTLTVQAPPSVTTPMAVTTFAGLAGTSGSTNDTGAAARFTHPSDVATDSAGNVYVVDTDNHTLRRITPAGVVTLFAGQAGTSGSTNGAATVARFNLPSGITVDSTGILYVADTLNHTVRKISTAGTVSLVAGSAGNSGSADGIGSAARFFAPQGLAVAPNGTDLYVADTNNHTIRRIDLLTGTVSTLAGLAGQSGSADGTGNGARFNSPSDVAVDKAGNLYVADTDNNTIRTLTPAGAVGTLAGLPGSSGAADGTAGSARFNHPSALVVDSAYSVYVLDTDNHAIRKIVSAAGVVTTVAGQAGSSGSADGSGATARFNYPSGIALASDTFFIADTNNHTIRRGVFSVGPVITSHPQGTTVTAGATVQLFVTATGQPAPTYQWQFNGSAVAGATGDTLTLANAQPAQSGKYSVVATNASGSVTSNEATVTINAPVVSGGSSGGSSGSSGGGGGGAPSTWFYLALLLLAAGRLVHARRVSKKLPSSSAS